MIKKFDVIAVEPNMSLYPYLKIVNNLNAINEADILSFLVGHKSFRTHTVEHGLDFCGVINNEKM